MPWFRAPLIAIVDVIRDRPGDHRGAAGAAGQPGEGRPVEGTDDAAQTLVVHDLDEGSVRCRSRLGVGRQPVWESSSELHPHVCGQPPG